jgi:V/A-type H+-transporting ATPase subunit E
MFFRQQRRSSPDEVRRNKERVIMVKTLGDITTELAEQVLMPAKAEAEKILRDAETEAGRIVAAAKEDAVRIRDEAQREAESIRCHMTADLDKAARNFLIMVEEQLERAIVDPVVDDAVREALNDGRFLEKMILEILAGFSAFKGQESRIEILLPEAQREQLDNWLLMSLRAKASQPLTVTFTDKISFGFKIGDEGTGTHFNFGEGLVQAFSEFCSPRFRKHFFRRSAA